MTCGGDPSATKLARHSARSFSPQTYTASVRKRTRREDRGEESADSESPNVLRERAANLEDGEDAETEQENRSPSELPRGQLRQSRPFSLFPIDMTNDFRQGLCTRKRTISSAGATLRHRLGRGRTAQRRGPATSISESACQRVYEKAERIRLRHTTSKEERCDKLRHLATGVEVRGDLRRFRLVSDFKFRLP